MELIEIEASRAINLMHLRRMAGELYLPEAAAQLVQRYSFAKHPTLQDLTETRESFIFGIGKFADTQVHELRIYSDGLIAEARSNTNILDAFMDDLVEWSNKQFGIDAAPTTPVERHYESSIIVRANADLCKPLKPAAVLGDEIYKMLKKGTHEPRRFSATGILLGVDPNSEGSRRKETRFVLDRRAGTSFAENIYYSQAPLRTEDHLAVLERLEASAR